MRLFRCQACGQTVYFENTRCERCGSRLGYLPEIGLISALEPALHPGLVAVLDEAGLLELSGLQPESDDAWLARLVPGRLYRACANAAYEACNWSVPADSGEAYCTACRHNRWIADLSVERNLVRWRRIEHAKHRLFYSLLKLKLPLPTRAEHPEGLAFDFLDDPPDPDAPRVITGHGGGLITIALREADDVEREKIRKSLGEPYRTLLGHFRHETGHYVWDKLVRNGGRVETFRVVFGDERANYAEALAAYYARGAPLDWRGRFVSAYATMHPWEDFAETWAHYLHIVDTLETAAAHGVEVHPRDGGASFRTALDFDPYHNGAFDPLIHNWVPLALAANSLNRSMGQPDLYPFILTAAVIDKLRFMHDLVHAPRSDPDGDR